MLVLREEGGRSHFARYSVSVFHSYFIPNPDKAQSCTSGKTEVVGFPIAQVLQCLTFFIYYYYFFFKLDAAEQSFPRLCLCMES